MDALRQPKAYSYKRFFYAGAGAGRQLARQDRYGSGVG